MVYGTWRSLRGEVSTEENETEGSLSNDDESEDALTGLTCLQRDAHQSEDSQQYGDEEAAARTAKLIGCLYSMGLCFCLTCYFLGMYLPLIEIHAFPYTPMEYVMTKSTRETIKALAEGHYFFASAALIICSIVIPVLKFVSCVIVIRDRYFAPAYSWTKLLTPRARTLVVSCMHATSSYQLLDLFCALLFLCFFTREGSVAYLKAGFYFFSVYCASSLVLVQLMERTHEKDYGATVMEAAMKRGLNESLDNMVTKLDIVPVVKGAPLRRKYSEYFPSLHGVKDVSAIDAKHVLVFAILWSVLLCVGFWQPMLQVRLLFKGITLESKTLSLAEMAMMVFKHTHVVVGVAFLLVTLVCPATYVVLLVIAGAMDHRRRRWSDPVEAPSEEFRSIMHVIEWVRPWAMTDVLAISIVVFLFSVQSPDMVGMIPDGWINPVPGLSKAFFSGVYLITGAGVAMYFLRWFWSFTDTKLLPDLNGSENDEAAPDRRIRPKICSRSVRCIMWWLVISLLLHAIPPDLPKFELPYMNYVLNTSVPVVNGMFSNSVPASYGECEPEDSAPLPCQKGPPIYHGKQFGQEITAKWITGLNTTRVDSLEVAHVLWEGATGTPKHRYKLKLRGHMDTLRLFVDVRSCELNETCKPLLASDQACCGAGVHHFGFEIDADCHTGDSRLVNISVQNLRFDALIVQPTLHLGVLPIPLPSKDITSMVISAIQDKVAALLAKKDIIWWGTKYLGVIDLTHKILNYNSPQQEFRCGQTIVR